MKLGLINCYLLALLVYGPLVHATSGPAVAFNMPTGKNPAVTAGAIHSMMTTDLVNDLQRGCQGAVVETQKREVLREEIARSNTQAFDPTGRLQQGQLMQPDIVIDGTIGGDGSTLTYTFEAKDALTGEVVAQQSGSASTDDVLHVTGPIAHRLVEKLCKKTAGYQLNGVMDEGTIKGTICGKLDKPFTATSPEVAGTWKFVPKGAGGSFSYTAKNIGGVPGSGAGTYVIVQGKDGSQSIKLSGTGTVHSPMGNFSAAITESIRLTPIKTCGRVGIK